MRDQLRVVGDQQRRASDGQSLDRPANRGGALGVEVGGRFVEHDEPRVAQERPTERDSLRLPRGQPAAAIADGCVEAIA